MKLTEKELNEFPIGTKIEAIDVLSGKIIFTKTKEDYWMEKIFWCSNKQILEKQIQKVEIPTYTEYIPHKPILDDKEKEYLSSLVKPFKSKVKYIIKEKLYCNNSKSKEYIAISCFNSIDSFEMPLFKSNTMYKGMELDKEYSLEELEI